MKVGSGGHSRELPRQCCPGQVALLGKKEAIPEPHSFPRSPMPYPELLSTALLTRNP